MKSQLDKGYLLIFSLFDLLFMEFRNYPGGTKYWSKDHTVSVQR